jgi:uncharacterized protein YlbG (UPF0298 family)
MNNVQVMIDFSNIDPELELAQLETLTRRVADELEELTETVAPVREAEIPEGSKPALAGFVLGILQAEVNAKNIKATLDFLGNRFYGKTVKLEYEDGGAKYSIEYTNPQQLDQAVSAIERLSKIKISVEQAKG